MKRWYIFLVMAIGVCMEYSSAVLALEQGFVYLHEVDPTILTSLRYFDRDNFLGNPVEGYQREVVIISAQAAEGLKKAQALLKKDGYSLVIYDAYRPQRAVDHFMRWSKDLSDDKMKLWFYPREDKTRVFDLGYVAARSGHSRGSTVDVTMIRLGKRVQAIQPIARTLKDGFVIQYLEDGTEDMGSSFDLFDIASHYENDVIAKECQERRTYLKNVMAKAGFKGYDKEWWHFTLEQEPFPDTYFDFPIQ